MLFMLYIRGSAFCGSMAMMHGRGVSCWISWICCAYTAVHNTGRGWIHNMHSDALFYTAHNHTQSYTTTTQTCGQRLDDPSHHGKSAATAHFLTLPSPPRPFPRPHHRHSKSQPPPLTKSMADILHPAAATIQVPMSHTQATAHLPTLPTLPTQLRPIHWMSDPTAGLVCAYKALKIYFVL